MATIISIRLRLINSDYSGVFLHQNCLNTKMNLSKAADRFLNGKRAGTGCLSHEPSLMALAPTSLL